MTDVRVEAMRAGRRSPQVVLHKYIAYKSKNCGRTIFAVEGSDDVTFYQTVMSRLNPTYLYSILNCDGKTQVLNLFQELKKNVDHANDNVRYFVDRDFDDLRGVVNDGSIYMTPSYSIENLLVNEYVLKNLLIAEYRCCDINSNADIAAASDLFKVRLEFFLENVRYANKILYCCRKNNIETNSLDEIVSPKIGLIEENIGVKLTDAEIANLVPRRQVLAVEFDGCEEEFAEIYSVLRLRGKFLLQFFKIYLKMIKADRGSKKPKHFSSKARVTFDPMGDIYRALASIFEVPPCMREFLVRL